MCAVRPVTRILDHGETYRDRDRDRDREGRKSGAGHSSYINKKIKIVTMID